MNYISVYIYYTLEDEHKAFYFLCFLVEEYLSEHFSDDLSGVMKLGFIVDKNLEVNSGFLWNKFAKVGLTSVHFTVSLFLTVFATYITNKNLYPFVDRIWDLFLADKYIGLIRICLYLLKAQEREMLKMDEHELMYALKRIDASPLGISMGPGSDPNVESLRVQLLVKKKLLSYKLDVRFYEYLSEYYDEVHMRLERFRKKNGL